LDNVYFIPSYSKNPHFKNPQYLRRWWCCFLFPSYDCSKTASSEIPGQPTFELYSKIHKRLWLCCFFIYEDGEEKDCWYCFSEYFAIFYGHLNRIC
jgi:hypothetical protein